jgi:hypothetical protein
MKTKSAAPTPQDRPGLRTLLKLGLSLAGLTALCGLVFFLLPYARTASLLNQLASDGNVEFFTSSLFEKIRPLFLALFAIFLGTSIFAWIKFSAFLQLLKKAAHFTSHTLHFFGQSCSKLTLDFVHFFERRDLPGMGLLTLLALTLRLLLIRQPMEHDESYSAVIFAFEPLSNGLSDYHFPNNHVLHTFFVHIAYQLFGAQEWAVRLPALLSGLLLVPAGYVLAKAWYGRKTALLAAALIAFFPELIQYSANARGYTLLALLTLLLFTCAEYARRHKNSAAWFLAGIFGALGFYTLPIMAYPLLVVYVWLGLSWLTNDFSPQYSKKNFPGYLTGSGLLAGGLGMALYVPIFRNWGVRSLLANPYTESIAKDVFSQVLLSRLTDTWQMLNRGGLPWIGLLLLLGLLFSYLGFRKIEKHKISLPILSLLVICALVAVQRPNVYSRTWIFYLPLLCIWSSAGWLAFSGFLAGKISQQKEKRLSRLLSVLIGLLFVSNGLLYTLQLAPAARKESGDVEQAALYLRERLKSGDIVVITAIDDAPMWFYFEKYGLGRSYFERLQPFQQAYVVVTENADQSTQSVIEERGPDRGFFDMGSTEKLTTINSLDIYLIQANSAAVEQAFAGRP